MLRRKIGVCLGVAGLIGLGVSTHLRAQEKPTAFEGILPRGPYTIGQDVKAVPPQKDENKAHGEWLTARIEEMQAVKVGMTRREVDKLLTVDRGGEVIRDAERYANPSCEMIKLDVNFRRARGTKFSDNSENDTVVKISSPLLDPVPNRARW